MKISVVIPIYNVAPYIEECLRSVMAQTITDMEVILVDDCGTDDSIYIAQRLIESYHGQIEFQIVHHKCNRGLSAARNSGIDVARGEYIGFIDSDDYIAPTMYEKLLSAIESDPSLGIVSCLPISFDENGERGVPERWKITSNRRILPAKYLERMVLQTSCHTAWGKLIRADLLRNVRFREGRNNEDTLFALEFTPIVLKYNVHMLELAEALYFYRQRETSITGIKNTNRKPLYFDEVANLAEVIAYTKTNNRELYNNLLTSFLWQLWGVLIKIRDNKQWHKYYYQYARYTRLIPNSLVRLEFAGKGNDYSLFLKVKYLPWYCHLRYILHAWKRKKEQ